MLVRHMATPDKIYKLSKEKMSSKVNWNDVSNIATYCYDEGATDILTHVAELYLEKAEDCFDMSKETREVTQITEEKHQELKNTLNEKEIPLLEAYDEAWHDMSASESYDYYIRGFIAGYRFLKSHVAHKGGRI